MNKMLGIKIIPNNLLPADFYVITDWTSPATNNYPEWYKILCIDGLYFAHPSTIDLISESIK